MQVPRATRPFLLFADLLTCQHATLFDTLTKLAELEAYVRLVAASDGAKRVALSYSRTATRKAQREALALASRFERLLVLLDVEEKQPRTVQQMLVRGRVHIAGG